MPSSNAFHQSYHKDVSEQKEGPYQECEDHELSLVCLKCVGVFRVCKVGNNHTRYEHAQYAKAQTTSIFREVPGDQA